MSSTNWTVTRVLPEPRQWQGERGPMVTYMLVIDDGHDEKFVYTNRKPETPAPVAGEILYGHYEDKGTWNSGKPKLKFVKEQKPDFQRPQTGTVRTFGDNATLNGSTPDTRSLRIERQSVQKAVGSLLSGSNPSAEDVKKWCDLLSADLDDYEKSRTAPPPAPAKEPEPAKHTEPEVVTEEEAVAALSDTDDIPF